MSEKNPLGVQPSKSSMQNLLVGTDQCDFYVWINPSDFLVRHQITTVGCFFSVPPGLGSEGPLDETLMFVPNPKFRGAISPFQNNLLRNYLAEYNLELSRRHYFPRYPCRLAAIFLLENKEDAYRYRERHMVHVGNRLLKCVKTNGPYHYSRHDSSWIDFMQTGHSMDRDTINHVVRAYWSGTAAEDAGLVSMGEPWSETPLTEVLFLGRVDFYDTDLDA
jgi:hypothetical protein